MSKINEKYEEMLNNPKDDIEAMIFGFIKKENLDLDSVDDDDCEDEEMDDDEENEEEDEEEEE